MAIRRFLAAGLVAALLAGAGASLWAQPGPEQPKPAEGAATAPAPAPGVIFDMETVQHKPTDVTVRAIKAPCGTATLVAGKEGKAVQFKFIDDARGGFMVGSFAPSEQWDKSAGFSFWVKGSGLPHFGGIELIDRSNFKLRYGYCFPIDSTEWKKIVVPWRDLIPELAAPLIDPGATDPENGYKPSGFGNFWFGKWFYWRDYPAHSYTIDQVVLEEKIELPQTPEPKEPGLTRLRAKLKAGKPITIVTMGDSLSDARHWANRKVLWSQLVAAQIQADYGSPVTVVNPAIGGTTLSQNLILMPRWQKDAPQPDLVTVWFGFNDWDSNIRGARFAEYLRLAVDRIRRQTGGSADILLMTTCPTHGRWETMAELEQAAKNVAAEKKTAVADITAVFHRMANPDDALNNKYWEWDKVHLGPRGHEATAEAVMQAIKAGK